MELTEGLVQITSVDFEFPGALDKLGQPLLSLSDKNCSAEGHASLTGSAKSGTDKLVESVLLVGVGHDDAMVLGAHVALDTLAIFGPTLVDIFTLKLILNKKFDI
jgi:hypothetical protein